MKLITLECPNCKAKLQLNPELNQASCNYCGYQFVVDDEAKHIKVDNADQMGYEFERGRMASQNEGADQFLIDRVRNIKEAQEQIDAIKANMEDSNKRIAGLMGRATELKKSVSKRNQIIAVIGIVLIAIFLIASDEGRIWFQILWGFLGIGLAVGAYFIFKIFYDKREEKRMDNLAQVNGEIEREKIRLSDFEKEITQLKKETDFEIIPLKYQKAASLEYILDTLENKVAINLNQAIRQYEDHRRQQQMIQMQNEQIALQKAQIEEMKALTQQNAMMNEEQKNNKSSGGALKSLMGLAAGAALGGVLGEIWKDK